MSAKPFLPYVMHGTDLNDKWAKAEWQQCAEVPCCACRHSAKLLFKHYCICKMCKRCICAIWIGVVQSGGAFVQWTMCVLVHHFFVFDSASPLAHICVCTIHYFSLRISATHFLPQCITLCNTKNQRTLDIFCRKAEDSFLPLYNRNILRIELCQLGDNDQSPQFSIWSHSHTLPISFNFAKLLRCHAGGLVAQDFISISDTTLILSHSI